MDNEDENPLPNPSGASNSYAMVKMRAASKVKPSQTEGLGQDAQQPSLKELRTALEEYKQTDVTGAGVDAFELKLSLQQANLIFSAIDNGFGGEEEAAGAVATVAKDLKKVLAKIARREEALKQMRASLTQLLQNTDVQGWEKDETELLTDLGIAAKKALSKGAVEATADNVEAAEKAIRELEDHLQNMKKKSARAELRAKKGELLAERYHVSDPTLKKAVLNYAIDEEVDPNDEERVQFLLGLAEDTFKEIEIVTKKVKEAANSSPKLGKALSEVLANEARKGKFDFDAESLFEKVQQEAKRVEVRASKGVNEIQTLAKNYNLPVDANLTEAILKYVIDEHVDPDEDSAVEKALGNAEEVIQKLEVAHQTVKEALTSCPRLAPALGNILTAKEQKGEFEFDLGEVVQQAIDDSPEPKGEGIIINGMRVIVDGPMLVNNSPKLSRADKVDFANEIPAITVPLPALQVTRGGCFGIGAKVRIEKMNPNASCDGWKVGIIQDVRGNRVATYGDGSKVSKIVSHTVDSLTPPWFKGKSWDLTEGASVTVFNYDGPFWVVPSELPALGKGSGPAPITSLSIKDEFRAFLLIDVGGGNYKSLLLQEWAFTADLNGTKYSAGTLKKLDGQSDYGVVASGDGPQGVQTTVTR